MSIAYSLGCAVRLALSKESSATRMAQEEPSLEEGCG
jgi:hypothetical protein